MSVISLITSSSINKHFEYLLKNIRIWDIIEALKWVRQNIESFGGDPNRVTLHGVSSGSFIITMLCVSPLTKGLFNQAIIESGSAIVVQNNPSGPNQKLSQDTAKAVGCATDERTIQNDSQRVVDCLRGKL
ncbi:acetylcholinesterase-1 [Nephila pilipes]|uniref:Carboxylic ester hydrolase n=1 Tax=Nephila pilipes TaxID=299642 RepID=A0A8X6TK33_NEPPI|nr:acetylcholinesterase-1 [Nephila pilipes]